MKLGIQGLLFQLLDCSPVESLTPVLIVHFDHLHLSNHQGNQTLYPKYQIYVFVDILPLKQ